jgi:hypothetical protein
MAKPSTAIRDFLSLKRYLEIGVIIAAVLVIASSWGW